MTQKTDRYTISLSDCLEDIAENFIYAENEYSHVPSFVLVPLMFEAVNDLIDEFSTNPEKYISDRLREKIDEAVSEYLAA
jgi:hypothetical protein